jgi:serine/threonine protein kinase
MDSPATPPAAPAPLVTGCVVAEALRVVRHLHRSKHSDVYLVTDESRNGASFIAKVVRPDLLTHKHAVARTRAESARLCAVDHPSVLRCLRTLEEPPGSVLELIDGPSLRDHLRGGQRMTWREVARCGAQLAGALAAVHASGILHCDVKPANILVARDRYVLIDFDLARPPGPAGARLGTRQFSAPEQAEGGNLDAAVDAWGLGMVLFRAATGKLAFAGGREFPQLEVRPRRVDDIRFGGGQVTKVIDQLLARRPGDRPTLAWVIEELVMQAQLRED